MTYSTAVEFSLLPSLTRITTWSTVCGQVVPGQTPNQERTVRACTASVPCSCFIHPSYTPNAAAGVQKKDGRGLHRHTRAGTARPGHSRGSFARAGGKTRAEARTAREQVPGPAGPVRTYRRSGGRAAARRPRERAKALSARRRPRIRRRRGIFRGRRFLCPRRPGESRPSCWARRGCSRGSST